MGWRDRDWAKFDDDEWAALTAPRERMAPAPRTHRGLVVTLLAVLVSFGATLVVVALHFGTTAYVHRQHPSETSDIDVNWSPNDLTPTAAPGRICITVRERICASYTAGERPADALTRQLEADGITVRNG